MSPLGNRTPYARVSTTTYKLGDGYGSQAVYLDIDHNWDADCAGAPLKLRAHDLTVNISPQGARDLRDLLTDWLAEWDAISTRMEREENAGKEPRP